MQRSILYLQWKAARWVLLPFTVTAFALPLLVLMVALRNAQRGFAPDDQVLMAAAQGATLIPMLAVLAGVSLGLLAWAWDHREGHVYALALPVPRPKYVVMKFLAGAALLALPAAAFWLGAFTAALAVELPAALHAYPFALGLRFLLGMLILYALTFAFAAGTARLALWSVVGVLTFLIVGEFAVQILEHSFGVRGLLTPAELLHLALVRLPGPFHVFGGNWSLIDV